MAIALTVIFSKVKKYQVKYLQRGLLRILSENSMNSQNLLCQMIIALTFQAWMGT